jgi:hypothetical protein
MYKDNSDLTKKKNQMKFKLTLIKLLSDPETILQQVSVKPTEHNISEIAFRYHKKDDNTTSKK